jgi:hypothetical protein
MKKLLIPILSGLVFSCTNAPAQDLKFKEKIQKEFTVSPNSVLAVYNIDGFIKVEGYAGNKVLMEIDKTISAKTKESFEEGKAEFKLEFEQKGDSIVAYIAEPWDSRPNRNNNKWRNNHRNIEYNSKLNFTIKVPNSVNLRISTVNDGDIDVANVDGVIRANNVNGAITLKNVKNANDVHTINGDVNINFTALPPDNAQFYTLNGDLRVTLPANLSADCELKTFQGEFFTDFENVEKLPSKITKIVKENDGGTTHKLSKGDAIRIGNGGKILKFETFNGNIYIKKS